MAVNPIRRYDLVRVAITGALCVVGGALLVRLVSSTNVSARRSVAPVGTEVSDLTRTVADLRRRVDRLQSDDARRTATDRSALEATASAASSVDNPTAPRDTVTPEEEELMLGADARTLEEQTRTEPADPQWSATAEAKIRAALGVETSSGAHVLAVTCRSTVCQVRLSFANLEDRNHFGFQSGRLVIAGGEGFMYVDSPADLDVELYLSRSGPVLPSALAKN